MPASGTTTIRVEAETDNVEEATEALNALADAAERANAALEPFGLRVSADVDGPDSDSDSDSDSDGGGHEDVERSGTMRPHGPKSDRGE